jgi:putative sigma-54 modulation protein
MPPEERLMRLDVTFKNCHSTEALKERATRKFEKAAKYLREPIEAHMVVQVEKHRHIADLTVTASGEVFKAEVVTDDMYTTIDAIMEKIERVAKRHKDRTTDHKAERKHGDDTGEVDGFGVSETT